MLIREEMGRRFGDRASITYIDTSDQAQREAHADLVSAIQERNLIYPVTVVDGEFLYDGAVSYPAILRAVDARLATPA
jgi:disulfide oxidoreductase YuzD